MLRIVKMTRRHIDDSIKIGKAILPGYDFVSKKFLENALSRKGAHLVAMQDGKLVGCIMVEEQDVPRSWIYYFVVSMDCQRMGIGTKLLKSAEQKLKQNSYLFVDVGRDDKSGRKFYKKNGFEISGIVKHWFEKEEEGIIMTKRIQK